MIKGVDSKRLCHLLCFLLFVQNYNTSKFKRNKTQKDSFLFLLFKMKMKDNTMQKSLFTLVMNLLRMSKLSQPLSNLSYDFIIH